jgi:hypothetical protein
MVITLLQQEDCVGRSAERAAPHQGKDALAQRVSMKHLLSVCDQASFSEQIGRVACLTAGLQAKACLLRHPDEDPSLLSSVTRALQQLFTNARIFVNEKASPAVIILQILRLGGFDPRDLEGEMMGKHRPITTKEPIKSEAVFFANAEGCVDG